MKTSLSTFAALALLAFSSVSSATATPTGIGGVLLENDLLAIGQGEIRLNNLPTSQNVFVSILAAAWDGTSPLLSSLSPSLSPLVQFGTSTSVFAANAASGFEGTFNAGLAKAPVGAGGQSQFQVIAWITTTGQSFAQAGIKGQSAVWGQATGGTDLVPPITGTQFAPVQLTFGGGVVPNLALVPEPSAIALGVLGGLGLLLRRRK